MPKRQRITRSAEIVHLLRTGKRWSSADVKVYFRENPSGADRLAVLVSRRLGSSVQRNRLKRCVREMVRGAVTPTCADACGLDLAIRPCPFSSFDAKRARTCYQQWRKSFGV